MHPDYGFSFLGQFRFGVPTLTPIRRHLFARFVPSRAFSASLQRPRIVRVYYGIQTILVFDYGLQGYNWKEDPKYTRQFQNQQDAAAYYGELCARRDYLSHSFIWSRKVPVVIRQFVLDSVAGWTVELQCGP